MPESIPEMTGQEPAETAMPDASSGPPEAAEAVLSGPETEEEGETPAFDGASNEQTIFAYLTAEMGLNAAAACGILASISCESGFDPHVSGDSGTSYGICQWHAGRFTSLKNYCSSKGYDYTSLISQLYYLEYELKQSYRSIWSYLQGVPDTAEGAYDAGYYWCYHYEVPANKAAVSAARGKLARDTYWPKYGTSSPTPVTIPTPPPIATSTPTPTPAPTATPAPLRTCTVSFAACGGTAPAAATVTEGSTLASIPVSERSGFRFEGWFSRENGFGTRLAADTVITQNVVWYAYWTPMPIMSYTITYDAAGGGSAPMPQTKTAGSDLLLTATKPSRRGYTFLGWAEEPGAAVPTRLPGSVYRDDRDITLYAVWQRTGDADGDDAVTCADAACILRGKARASGDTDGDSRVTNADAMQILRGLVGR